MLAAVVVVEWAFALVALESFEEMDKSEEELELGRAPRFGRVVR
jgi:hypothetical protein